MDIYRTAQTSSEISGFVVLGAGNESGSINEAQFIAVKNLEWSINSIGHIELVWDDGTKIARISGNGRFDFSQRRVPRPKEAKGIISITTKSFDPGDVFTLHLTGLEN